MDTDLDKTKDKDAELARWREQALQEDATANALRDQVTSLTSLVKELADNALLLKDEVCVGCPQKLSVCEEQKCSLVKNTDALVAKAREVCK